MGIGINNLYRFEGFELDVANRAISRHGCPITVPPKAFDLLAYMAGNPERLLTKEELMGAIWADVAVEEGNLTQNVFILRKALSASRFDAGKLIVTVSGRGYRFAASVEEIGPYSFVRGDARAGNGNGNGFHSTPTFGDFAAEASPASVSRASRSSLSRWLTVGLSVLATVAAIVFLPSLIRRRSNDAVPLPHPVTMNSFENPVVSLAISPDGRYLAYATAQTITLQTMQSSETHSIPAEAGTTPTRVTWYPDGTRLLVSERTSDSRSLLLFSLLSGKLSALRADAQTPAISPDGTRIVYCDGSLHALWLIDGNGENARQFLTVPAPDKLYPMFWSPNGLRLWFARVHWDKDKEVITLETCDLNGAHRTVALSDNHASAFRLLPKGRLIYARREDPADFTNLWELPVNPAEGKPEGPARKLTNWTNFSISGISATDDGKQLALLNGRWQSDVYLGDLRGGGNELVNTRRLTLDESDDSPAFWTPDDQSLIFTSNRNGRSQVFRQRLDQTIPELLSMDSGEDLFPRFGGLWTYFRSVPAGGRINWNQPLSLRRMPANGGASEEILRDTGIDIGCAAKQPDICALARLRDKTLVFYRLDRSKVQGAEIGRMEYDSRLFPIFKLSPDGSEIAVLNPRGQGNSIRRIPLDGRTFSEVEVKGRKELYELAWAPDGTGWFVSSTTPANGGYLLHVNLRGDSQVLFEQPDDGRDTFGIPSHNGQQLAFLRWTAPKNVWMIDGF